MTVNSSAIDDIDHDSATNVLTVTFASGARYAYAGVDAIDYAQLMAAPSIGRHFAEHIRGKFPFTKVDPD